VPLPARQDLNRRFDKRLWRLGVAAKRRRGEAPRAAGPSQSCHPRPRRGREGNRSMGSNSNGTDLSGVGPNLFGRESNQLWHWSSSFNHKPMVEFIRPYRLGGDRGISLKSVPFGSDSMYSILLRTTHR
jgi:hypothetical protein